MKRHGDLFYKITDLDNILQAFEKVTQGKKNYREVKRIQPKVIEFAYKIKEMLENHTYTIKPENYTRKVINEGSHSGTKKERELFKLRLYPHRWIHWCIMLVVRDIFLKHYCYHSCACIPNGGIKRAHALTVKYLKDKENTKYCLKIDIKKFYPSINKEILKQKLRKKFKDPDLLWLFDMIIDSYPKDRGVAIGLLTSQYFSNYFLSDFDHYLKEKLKVKKVIRYMDDVTIYASNKEYLHELLKQIKEYLKNELDLELKGNYQIFPVDKRGVDFVGYVFRHDSVRLRKSSALTLRLISNAVKKHQKVTDRQFSALNSICGNFQFFNSTPLFEKYAEPIVDYLKEYYNESLSEDLSEEEKTVRLEHYINKLLNKKLKRAEILTPKPKVIKKHYKKEHLVEYVKAKRKSRKKKAEQLNLLPPLSLGIGEINKLLKCPQK